METSLDLSQVLAVGAVHSLTQLFERPTAPFPLRSDGLAEPTGDRPGSRRRRGIELLVAGHVQRSVEDSRCGHHPTCLALVGDVERTLGIDLAGVTGATGYALIEEEEGARLGEAGLIPVKGAPIQGEERLLDLIDRLAPDRIAIDAPLTLPPCLTCPSYCRGPGDLCELQAAREMWSEGSNPIIRRHCEVAARQRIAGLDPKPTMGFRDHHRSGGEPRQKTRGPRKATLLDRPWRGDRDLPGGVASAHGLYGPPRQRGAGG